MAADQETQTTTVQTPVVSSPTEQNFRDLMAQPSVDWDQVQWARFSPKETHMLKHRMMEQKHRGHEMMHLEMILIFFGFIFAAQFLLVFWKLKHRKSYQLVTLFGLWIMPIVISIGALYVRMMVVWTVFSAITGFFIFKATRRSITGSTPRLVYRWFLLVHQVTTVVAILGYVVMVLVFSGLVLVFGLSLDSTMEFALMLLFYGVYFGVLGRDCAEMCVDLMAASMKYTSSKGAFPDATLVDNICAVCEREILSNEDSAASERAYKLNCRHVFHEFCIRGWCMVGKKQTCPYCKEKVDLKAMFRNPWEKPHILFGQMLDVVRYMVVWFPIISFSIQAVYYVLKLE